MASNTTALCKVIRASIFREYDIRGVVGQELDEGVAAAIATAYAGQLRARGQRDVVVGRDNRRSSPALAGAVGEALSRAGCRVIDIGTVVTPVFYFARVHYSVEGGVMVTASHNPPHFNGFKLASGFGTMYGEEIQELWRAAQGLAEVAAGRGGGVGGTSHGPAGRVRGAAGVAGASRRTGKSAPVRRRPNGAYLCDLTGRLKLGPRHLKVAVDCGNGTAGYIAPDFLERLGCEVVPLYCNPDPSFPNHHPDPVQPANLRDLIALVRREKCDLGVAFDGDGDRLGVVDERGNILWGDIIMVLYWREVLAKHPGAEALIEVKCSQALFEEVERLGGRPSFYRTGHSLIKARMREIGAPFAGEMSGHMFFADEYYGYDDALYAAGRLLRILSNSDRALSELVSDVPRYHSSPETRVDCPDSDKFRVVEETRERFRRRYPVIDVDGARVLFPEGWGLIRASNTQPALVLRCEARTPAALREIAAALSTELAGFPSVGIPEWEI